MRLSRSRRIRVRVLQDPSQALFAHRPRWVLGKQESMEFCDPESGMFVLQRYDGRLEILFGRRDQGRRHEEMTGWVVALSDRLLRSRNGKSSSIVNRDRFTPIQ